MTERAGRATHDRRIIAAAVVIFVVLYAIWYPRTFSIIDESTYLSTAYAYRAGTIYHDEAGISSVTRIETDGHRVSKFGPLMPLLLMPFTWVGWRATFTANLLMHLIGFWLFFADFTTAFATSVGAVIAWGVRITMTPSTSGSSISVPERVLA